MTKEELAKRYAGDEHQPDYLAFLAGWDAAMKGSKQEYKELMPYLQSVRISLVQAINEIHAVEQALKGRVK